MSFGAREARETRIKADRKPRVNLCGACGDEISETELLCVDCRNQPSPVLATPILRGGVFEGADTEGVI